MIEIIHPDKPSEFRKEPLEFVELQNLVGGYVQMIAVVEKDVIYHVCCNEDGIALRLPENPFATERLRDKISMYNFARGTWVVLSGKDLLK